LNVKESVFFRKGVANSNTKKQKLDELESFRKGKLWLGHSHH